MKNYIKEAEQLLKDSEFEEVDYVQMYIKMENLIAEAEKDTSLYEFGEEHRYDILQELHQEMECLEHNIAIRYLHEHGYMDNFII